MLLNNTFKNKSLVLLFSFLFVFCSSSVMAHNPSHSSTMLVEGENNEWTLIVSSSLTAFQKEIRNKYSVDGYKTPEEFRQLVIKHLTENIAIICDDKEPVKLENLTVKLGHGTKAGFKVIGMPKEFNTISVKNTSFLNISRNQSALIIIKKGIEKEQFVLDKKNNHTLNLEIQDSKFGIKKTENKSYKILLIIGALLIPVLLIVFFIYKKRKN